MQRCFLRFSSTKINAKCNEFALSVFKTVETRLNAPYQTFQVATILLAQSILKIQHIAINKVSLIVRIMSAYVEMSSDLDFVARSTESAELYLSLNQIVFERLNEFGIIQKDEFKLLVSKFLEMLAKMKGGEAESLPLFKSWDALLEGLNKEQCDLLLAMLLKEIEGVCDKKESYFAITILDLYEFLIFKANHSELFSSFAHQLLNLCRKTCRAPPFAALDAAIEQCISVHHSCRSDEQDSGNFPKVVDR